jgi:hypothetical protein
VITRAYRVLLHLYPRRFHREYGDDMVLLLEDQLRDEGAARVVGRAVLDLLITVPTRHLEVHMKRSSTTTAVIVLVALGVVLAVVGGPMGLAAGLAIIAVALVTWRRSQPVVAADGHWWKLLGGGALLLTAEIVITTITGELHHGLWYVAMVVGLTSFVLMATGLVLGIAGRVRPKVA